MCVDSFLTRDVTGVLSGSDFRAEPARGAHRRRRIIPRDSERAVADTQQLKRRE